MKNTNSEFGFTLIELLVVIAIIGLMASIALAAFNNARISSRDVKRLSDMSQIKKALELYFLNNNAYPSMGTETEPPCGGWDSASVDADGNGRFFIEGLETSGIITKMPKDPLSSGNCAGYNYRFYVYSAGLYSSCPRNFYVLGILDLEKTSGAHPNSPGWSCGKDRDWQNEFEWVTGGFEQ